MRLVQRNERSGQVSRRANAEEIRSEPAVVAQGGVVGWLLGLVAQHGSARERRDLRVIETLALGGRKQLLLVACGTERYLVGTGADSVETIVPVGFHERKIVEETCL